MANRTKRSDGETPHWFRDNALLIVCLAIFALCMVGMAASGFQVANTERLDHGLTPLTLGQYLTSGAFAEATFENWESEFLQMGAYVVLTIFLFQKGSSESKPIGTHTPQDDDPRNAKVTPDSPWPVRRGGVALLLYENSLAIFFSVLFALSFWFHAVGGAAAYSEEQALHGLPRPHADRIPRHRAVLVRVDAELAERVPRRRGHRRGIGVPAAAGLTGVEARRDAASRDRHLSRAVAFAINGWTRRGGRDLNDSCG